MELERYIGQINNVILAKSYTHFQTWTILGDFYPGAYVMTPATRDAPKFRPRAFFQRGGLSLTVYQYLTMKNRKAALTE